MKRFAVIGDPIDHSLSPTIHSVGFQAIGLLANYEAIELSKENFVGWWQKNSNLYDGFSVTMPLKELAANVADSLDIAAKDIGVANTMIKVDNQWVGYNTDWLGYLRPLEKVDAINGKRVLILGAGGAAHAAVYSVLQANPLELLVHNRTIEHLNKLRQDFPGLNVLEEIIDLDDIDTVINTTSVGMAELVHESPIDTSLLDSHHVVYESIYKPPQTLLMQEASKRGAVVISGFELLLSQAYEQFQLFTGQSAPQQIMREAIGQ
ncbi:shikimate dehydrogenase [Candidatus Saccharibacteria bacterium]|nr:shikimate dehydrogenase [Candidatus Saccharibacteria bacterium]